MTETHKPTLPPKISGAKPRPKPNGWWSLPGHEFDGTRAGVLKAINDASDVPQRWKDHIAAEIEEIGAEFNHITVNCHVCINQSPDGKLHERIYDFDIAGLKKL